MGLLSSFVNALLNRVEYQVIVIGSNKKAITKFLCEIVDSMMPLEFDKLNAIKFQKDTVMIICACCTYVSAEYVDKLLKHMEDNKIPIDVYILKTRNNFYSSDLSKFIDDASLTRNGKFRFINMMDDFFDGQHVCSKCNQMI